MTSIDVIQEVQQNFLDGSYDTNANRAFPNVKDGLKPGQRACLWEMFTKKYNSKKPHVKSAKIDGGVAALWWPHGTTAIYETFARMSQPFTNNLPEVDFHGANGNIILGGDAIAADRYTEARLAKITEEGMLQGIDKRNVPMIPNFSEDEEWPQVLPAVFPRLLVNGAQGIGVGVANVWLPHNFTETANLILKYLNEGILEEDTYYPDFPTGGTIVNRDELAEINKTGKGKVIVEAKYRISGNEIDFYEMPYQVYIEPVIEKIKECVDKEELPGIAGVYNKSDKNKISLVVECRSGTEPEKMVQLLFAMTPLRSQYNANQNGIISKTPILLTLKEVVDVYTEHNKECIRREYEHEFGKAAARIEILEGLSKALEDIENIIVLIKQSASATVAKTKLIEKYNFSEVQAKAILDMKLARLANLEKVEVNNELEEKRAYAAECKAIMESQPRQKSILIQRLQELVKKFGDKRRTDVTQKTIVKMSKAKEAKVVIPEDVVVTVNKDGYLQSIPLKAYKTSKTGIINSFKTQTTDMILLFTNKAKVYRILVSDIAQCGVRDKGTAAGSILKMEPGEKVLNIFSMNIDEAHPYITGFTKGGLVKKSDKTIYIGSARNLNGLKAAGLNENDEFISVYESNGDYGVVGTNNGMIIRFELDKVNPVGKTAKGVKSIALGENDFVTAATVVPKSAKSIKINGNNTDISKIVVQGRAGKGRQISDTSITIGD